MKSYLYQTSLLIVIVFTTSCKKFIETGVNKELITTDKVFGSDATAQAAVTGIYHDMVHSTSFAGGSFQSVWAIAGLSSDELLNFPRFDAAYLDIERNEIAPQNNYVMDLWSSMYKIIYGANSAINGLSTATSITDTLKTQLMGEAYFVRAFSHFYLVNLFGDVPFVNQTRYQTNAVVSRMPSAIVYDSIVQDLLLSEQLLGASYIKVDPFAEAEKVRPNESTAAALLARVYLYTGKWPLAESAATSIIENTNLYNLTSIEDVFLKNSGEAIWQLKPVQPNFNTYEGLTGVPSFGNIGYNVVDSNLAKSFGSTDIRKTSWLGNFDTGTEIVYYPNKYKQFESQAASVTEYSMVFRLAEQYLIRAEARAMQGNLTGANSAASDLNMIRIRAGLDPTDADDQQEMLAAIQNEKRLEFFAEWGHRWFDLKRWHKADEILGAKKSNWQTEDLLYPIPQAEMDKNPFLKPQNPNY